VTLLIAVYMKHVNQTQYIYNYLVLNLSVKNTRNGSLNESFHITYMYYRLLKLFSICYSFHIMMTSNTSSYIHNEDLIFTVEITCLLYLPLTSPVSKINYLAWKSSQIQQSPSIYSINWFYL